MQHKRNNITAKARSTGTDANAILMIWVDRESGQCGINIHTNHLDT